MIVFYDLTKMQKKPSGLKDLEIRLIFLIFLSITSKMPSPPSLRRQIR